MPLENMDVAASGTVNTRNLGWAAAAAKKTQPIPTGRETRLRQTFDITLVTAVRKQNESKCVPQTLQGFVHSTILIPCPRLFCQCSVPPNESNVTHGAASPLLPKEITHSRQRSRLASARPSSQDELVDSRGVFVCCLASVGEGVISGCALRNIRCFDIRRGRQHGRRHRFRHSTRGQNGVQMLGSSARVLLV